MSDGFLTTRQAAEKLGIAAKTLTEWARLSKIEAHKRGRVWYIDLASLDRYMRESGPRTLPPELHDPAALDRLYRETGSLRALAKRLGCCVDTVRKAVRRHGIEIPYRR